MAQNDPYGQAKPVQESTQDPYAGAREVEAQPTPVPIEDPRHKKPEPKKKKKVETNPFADQNGQPKKGSERGFYEWTQTQKKLKDFDATFTSKNADNDEFKEIVDTYYEGDAQRALTAFNALNRTMRDNHRAASSKKDEKGNYHAGAYDESLIPKDENYQYNWKAWQEYSKKRKQDPYEHIKNVRQAEADLYGLKKMAGMPMSSQKKSEDNEDQPAKPNPVKELAPTSMEEMAKGWEVLSHLNPYGEAAPFSTPKSTKYWSKPANMPDVDAYTKSLMGEGIIGPTGEANPTVHDNPVATWKYMYLRDIYNAVQPRVVGGGDPELPDSYGQATMYGFRDPDQVEQELDYKMMVAMRDIIIDHGGKVGKDGLLSELESFITNGWMADINKEGLLEAGYNFIARPGSHFKKGFGRYGARPSKVHDAILKDPRMQALKEAYVGSMMALRTQQGVKNMMHLKPDAAGMYYFDPTEIDGWETDLEDIKHNFGEGAAGLVTSRDMTEVGSSGIASQALASVNWLLKYPAQWAKNEKAADPDLLNKFLARPASFIEDEHAPVPEIKEMLFSRLDGKDKELVANYLATKDETLEADVNERMFNTIPSFVGSMFMPMGSFALGSKAATAAMTAGKRGTAMITNTKHLKKAKDFATKIIEKHGVEKLTKAAEKYPQGAKFLGVMGRLTQGAPEAALHTTLTFTFADLLERGADISLDDAAHHAETGTAFGLSGVIGGNLFANTFGLLARRSKMYRALEKSLKSGGQLGAKEAEAATLAMEAKINQYREVGFYLGQVPTNLMQGVGVNALLDPNFDIWSDDQMVQSAQDLVISALFSPKYYQAAKSATMSGKRINEVLDILEHESRVGKHQKYYEEQFGFKGPQPDDTTVEATGVQSEQPTDVDGAVADVEAVPRPEPVRKEYTVAEWAEKNGMTAAGVRKAAKEGRIPGEKRDNKWVIFGEEEAAAEPNADAQPAQDPSATPEPAPEEPLPYAEYTETTAAEFIPETAGGRDALSQLEHGLMQEVSDAKVTFHDDTGTHYDPATGEISIGRKDLPRDPELARQTILEEIAHAATVPFLEKNPAVVKEIEGIIKHLLSNEQFQNEYAADQEAAARLGILDEQGEANGRMRHYLSSPAEFLIALQRGDLTYMREAIERSFGKGSFKGLMNKIGLGGLEVKGKRVFESSETIVDDIAGIYERLGEMTDATEVSGEDKFYTYLSGVRERTMTAEEAAEVMASERYQTFKSAAGPGFHVDAASVKDRRAIEALEIAAGKRGSRTTRTKKAKSAAEEYIQKAKPVKQGKKTIIDDEERRSSIQYRKVKFLENMLAEAQTKRKNYEPQNRSKHPDMQAARKAYDASTDRLYATRGRLDVAEKELRYAAKDIAKRSQEDPAALEQYQAARKAVDDIHTEQVPLKEAIDQTREALNEAEKKIDQEQWALDEEIAGIKSNLAIAKSDLAKYDKERAQKFSTWKSVARRLEAGKNAPSPAAIAAYKRVVDLALETGLPEEAILSMGREKFGRAWKHMPPHERASAAENFVRSVYNDDPQGFAKFESVIGAMEKLRESIQNAEEHVEGDKRSHMIRNMGLVTGFKSTKNARSWIRKNLSGKGFTQTYEGLKKRFERTAKHLPEEMRAAYKEVFDEAFANIALTDGWLEPQEVIKAWGGDKHVNVTRGESSPLPERVTFNYARKSLAHSMRQPYMNEGMQRVMNVFETAKLAVSDDLPNAYKAAFEVGDREGMEKFRQQLLDQGIYLFPKGLHGAVLFDYHDMRDNILHGLANMAVEGGKLDDGRWWYTTEENAVKIGDMLERMIWQRVLDSESVWKPGEKPRADLLHAMDLHKVLDAFRTGGFEGNLLEYFRDKGEAFKATLKSNQDETVQALDAVGRALDKMLQSGGRPLEPISRVAHKFSFKEINPAKLEKHVKRTGKSPESIIRSAEAAQSRKFLDQMLVRTFDQLAGLMVDPGATSFFGDKKMPAKYYNFMSGADSYHSYKDLDHVNNIIRGADHELFQLDSDGNLKNSEADLARLGLHKLKDGRVGHKVLVLTDDIAEQLPFLKQITGDVPASEWFDGASMYINRSTRALHAAMLGKNADEVGGIKPAWYGFDNGNLSIFKTGNHESWLDVMDSPDDNPQLAEFLRSLQSDGYSMVTFESSMKSDGNFRYNRVHQNGKTVMFDHRGRPVGTEQGGKFKKFNDEEAAAQAIQEVQNLMQGRPSKGMTKEIPLTGEDGLRLVSASLQFEKLNGVSNGLLSLPVTLPNDRLGKAAQAAEVLVRNNNRRASEIFKWGERIAAGEIPQGGLADQGFRDLISGVRNRISNEQTQLGKAWESPQSRKTLVNYLDSVFDENRNVIPERWIKLNAMVPGLFSRPNMAQPSVVEYVVSNALSDAHVSRMDGAGQIWLQPMGAPRQYMRNGVEYMKQLYGDSAESKEKMQALDELLRNGGEWDGVKNLPPLFDKDGKETDYHPYIFVTQDYLDKANKQIEIMNRSLDLNEKLDYIGPGSKVIMVLTPTDSAGSHVSGIIAGVMNGKNKMSASNATLRLTQGRDFDADGEGLAFNSDRWIDNAGKNHFDDYWAALYGANTADASAVKPKETALKRGAAAGIDDIESGRAARAVDHMGVPVYPQYEAQRPIDYDYGVRALRAAENQIGLGMDQQRRTVAAMRLDQAKEGTLSTFNWSTPVDKDNSFSEGKVVFGHNPEMNSQLSVWRQAHVDPYDAHTYDWDDVYMSSVITGLTRNGRPTSYNQLSAREKEGVKIQLNEFLSKYGAMPKLTDPMNLTFNHPITGSDPYIRAENREYNARQQYENARSVYKDGKTLSPWHDFLLFNKDALKQRINNPRMVATHPEKVHHDTGASLIADLAGSRSKGLIDKHMDTATIYDEYMRVMNRASGARGHQTYNRAIAGFVNAKEDVIHSAVAASAIRRNVFHAPDGIDFTLGKTTVKSENGELFLIAGDEVENVADVIDVQGNVAEEFRGTFGDFTATDILLGATGPVIRTTFFNNDNRYQNIARANPQNFYVYQGSKQWTGHGKDKANLIYLNHKQDPLAKREPSDIAKLAMEHLIKYPEGKIVLNETFHSDEQLKRRWEDLSAAIDKVLITSGKHGPSLEARALDKEDMGLALGDIAGTVAQSITQSAAQASILAGHLIGEAMRFTDKAVDTSIRPSMGAYISGIMDTGIIPRHYTGESLMHTIMNKWSKGIQPEMPTLQELKQLGASEDVHPITKERVLEGDIFEMEGIPVIPTNLGGVHGAGLAKNAARRGLIQRGSGQYSDEGAAVTLPVKQHWSNSMADSDNMALMKKSLDQLVATARKNSGSTYLLPLAGLGHGEGAVKQVMPLLFEAMRSAPNIKLVLPSDEALKATPKGTARTDETALKLPEIRKMLAEATVDSVASVKAQKPKASGKRTIIAGSRGIKNQALLDKIMTEHEGTVSKVVSGAAPGVDRMGETWAKSKGVEIDSRPADWDKHGKRAGMLRNLEMAKNAERLIAIWDGESKGTRQMINEARAKGLEVWVYDQYGNLKSAPSDNVGSKQKLHTWRSGYQKAEAGDIVPTMFYNKLLKKLGTKKYKRMQEVISQIRGATGGKMELNLDEYRQIEHDIQEIFREAYGKHMSEAVMGDVLDALSADRYRALLDELTLYNNKDDRRLAAMGLFLQTARAAEDQIHDAERLIGKTAAGKVRAWLGRNWFNYMSAKARQDDASLHKAASGMGTIYGTDVYYSANFAYDGQGTQVTPLTVDKTWDPILRIRNSVVYSDPVVMEYMNPQSVMHNLKDQGQFWLAEANKMIEELDRMAPDPSLNMWDKWVAEFTQRAPDVSQVNMAPSMQFLGRALAGLEGHSQLDLSGLQIRTKFNGSESSAIVDYNGKTFEWSLQMNEANLNTLKNVTETILANDFVPGPELQSMDPSVVIGVKPALRRLLTTMISNHLLGQHVRAMNDNLELWLTQKKRDFNGTPEQWAHIMATAETALTKGREYYDLMTSENPLDHHRINLDLSKYVTADMLSEYKRQIDEQEELRPDLKEETEQMYIDLARYTIGMDERYKPLFEDEATRKQKEEVLFTDLDREHLERHTAEGRATDRFSKEEAPVTNDALTRESAPGLDRTIIETEVADKTKAKRIRERQVKLGKQLWTRMMDHLLADDVRIYAPIAGVDLPYEELKKSTEGVDFMHRATEFLAERLGEELSYGLGARQAFIDSAFEKVMKGINATLKTAYMAEYFPHDTPIGRRAALGRFDLNQYMYDREINLGDLHSKALDTEGMLREEDHGLEVGQPVSYQYTNERDEVMTSEGRFLGVTKIKTSTTLAPHVEKWKADSENAEPGAAGFETENWNKLDPEQWLQDLDAISADEAIPAAVMYKNDPYEAKGVITIVPLSQMKSLHAGEKLSWMARKYDKHAKKRSKQALEDLRGALADYGYESGMDPIAAFGLDFHKYITSVPDDPQQNLGKRYFANERGTEDRRQKLGERFLGGHLGYNDASPAAQAIYDIARQSFAYPSLYLYGGQKHMLHVLAGATEAGIGVMTLNLPLIWSGGMTAGKAFLMMMGTHLIHKMGNYGGPTMRNWMLDMNVGKNEGSLKDLLPFGEQKEIAPAVAAATANRFGGNGLFFSDVFQHAEANKGLTVERERQLKQLRDVENIQMTSTLDDFQLVRTNLIKLIRKRLEHFDRDYKLAGWTDPRTGQHEFKILTKDNKSLSDLEQMGLDALNLALTPIVKAQDSYLKRTMKGFGRFATTPVKRLNKFNANQFYGVTESEYLSAVKYATDLNNQYKNIEAANKLNDWSPYTQAVSNALRHNYITTMQEQVLGKYNERNPYHLTPSGRLMSLFSQWTRNFYIQTTEGLAMREMLATEIHREFMKDPVYAKNLDRILEHAVINGGLARHQVKAVKKLGIAGALTQWPRLMGLIALIAQQAFDVDKDEMGIKILQGMEREMAEPLRYAERILGSDNVVAWALLHSANVASWAAGLMSGNEAAIGEYKEARQASEITGTVGGFARTYGSGVGGQIVAEVPGLLTFGSYIALTDKNYMWDNLFRDLAYKGKSVLFFGGGAPAVVAYDNYVELRKNLVTNGIIDSDKPAKSRKSKKGM